MERTRSQIGKSNVSRSKNHERRIANLMEEWTGESFRRRRVEGRDSTIVDRESTADVISVKHGFKFSIEAKCGAGFSLDSIFKEADKALFTTWWHQCCYDAMILEKSVGYKVYPLLFFKPIPAWDWVATSVDTIGDIYDSTPKNSLIYSGYSMYDNIECDVSHSHKNKNLVKLKLPDVIIMRWKNFVDQTDKNRLWVATVHHNQ